MCGSTTTRNPVSSRECSVFYCGVPHNCKAAQLVGLNVGFLRMVPVKIGKFRLELTLWFAQNNHSSKYVKKDDDSRQKDSYTFPKKKRIHKHLNGGTLLSTNEINRLLATIMALSFSYSPLLSSPLLD